MDLFPFYNLTIHPRPHQVHGFKLPGFHGAIQCGSGRAIGVHERLEESVPQDDPQWENMLKMHYLQYILGKNTEIFHSRKKFRILKSLLKTSPVERFMLLRTKLLQYLSEKQTYHERALDVPTAWPARRWVSKDV